MAGGRHRVVSLGRLVRSLAAISFTIVIAASVLPAILVALLWTCAKVLRHRATIPAPHWTGLLTLVENGLVVLHVGAHSIHGLALL